MRDDQRNLRITLDMLRQYADATLVGEPIGDKLELWSEGGNAVMPNSKLSLHYADRFHNYSGVEHPELNQYLVTSSRLRVTNAGPDILVTMSARDYFAGRDPALEAVKFQR